MQIDWLVCACVLIASFLILEAHAKIPKSEDSFDESFEDSSNDSPEVKKALQPTEDAFLGFLNRLVNTGYASSKIALNRIEKASQKRRELNDKLEEFLANLPNYREEIPVVDEMPRVLKNKHKPLPVPGRN